MRKSLAGLLFALSSLCGFAQDQSLPTLKRDSQAITLAAQVMSAGGGILPAATGVSMVGTLQIGKEATLYPMRVFTMGTVQSRVEVDKPGGTSTRILNNGKAAIVQSSGKVIRLNTLNTLGDRVPYIPVFSLISEYQQSNIQLEYLGKASLSGLAVEQIAVSWAEGVTPTDQKELLKRTRKVYSIDPSTSDVVQIEYDLCAEQDSSASRHYRVIYSAYKALGGRSIPTTITTFAQDVFLSEFKITAYNENADLSSVSFTLPEVSK